MDLVSKPHTKNL